MLVTIGRQLGMLPNLSLFIVMFFTFSFLGNIMECIVLSIEHKKLITNRGFAKHLPFCIIYGFGACLAFGLLSPLASNLPLLFITGAAGASLLEYITARIQIHIFGDFWWDYSKKPFNFQGILCLESTLGWGVVAIVVIKFLRPFVLGQLKRIPPDIASALAFLLVLAYVTDFAYSTYQARFKKKEDVMELEDETEARV